MVDFLIITALRKEFDPLRARFNAKRLPKNQLDDGYEHYEATVATEIGISYSVRLLCAGRKGAKYTTATVGCGIRRWKPRYLIMTGIAATVPGDARRIGHILVADMIVDLSEWKVLPGTEKARPDPFKCDFGLLQSIDAFPSSVDFATGIIIAQSHLIKSAKIREKLVDFAKKITGRNDIVGIEMEGGGLGAGIDTQPGDAKPGFILIKAAVDFANYHKNDAAQKKAASDAAAFVHDFLAFGPVCESGNASELSRSSVPGTNAIRSKGTLPSIEELEKHVRIHNRASFSEIGFSVGANFVPVRKVYVERTKAQSIIDTKLAQIPEPDLNQIIAVTGLAGSGKTSLLDHLSRRLGPKNTIPFLVRAEDLIDTDEPGYFQLRFNDFVSGDQEPPSWQVLRNMCERFSDEHRSFLVMIDTVDFLVTQSNFSWRSFYSLLVELASEPYIGICMTCRPYEFEHIKTDQFLQVPLGNLTDEEILIALNNYIDCCYEKNAFSEAQKKRLRERAESDDKFRRIVADPLKLRMLFEAYSGREIYKEEISTAKLYDRYWQVKIWSESRRPVPAHEPLSPLATYKDETCRNIAFGLLVDKKLEFDEPQSVGDASDSSSRRAWTELRSDAVIHQPVATIRKYQFFHETFLEYAAARHIAASSRSSIATDWLVQHLARNADFFVAPVISHLAVLDPALACKIAQSLYTAKAETIDPLFTKRLASEIFTNVEEPERSAVGGYLLTASLRDENQLLIESLVQRAGHLPSASVPFALTLLAKVWRAKRSDRIHLLALQALADLSRADAKSVWNWMQKEGIEVLEFNDSNRESGCGPGCVEIRIFGIHA
jgi:nucleoside phosphorylase